MSFNASISVITTAKKKKRKQNRWDFFHRHLAKNPFICDCNLRWLSAYLHAHPIETSGAKCESPKRAQKRKIDSMRDDKFKCKGKHNSTFSVSLLKTSRGQCIQVGSFSQLRSRIVFPSSLKLHLHSLITLFHFSNIISFVSSLHFF